MLAIIDRYNQGMATRSLSKEFGISEKYLNKILIDNNIKTRKRNRKGLDDRKEEIINLYKEGLRSNQISKKLNIPATSLRRKMSEIGLDINEDRLPPNYKITYGVNENFFERIDSEEKAYTLGIMYADGCVYKNTMIIGVTDKEIVENIKKFMKYEGFIKEYKKDNKCKIIYKLRIKREKIYENSTVSLERKFVKSRKCLLRLRQDDLT